MLWLSILAAAIVALGDIGLIAGFITDRKKGSSESGIFFLISSILCGIGLVLSVISLVLN